MFEEHKRSIVKALTYRLFIIILDFTFVYLLTSRIELATSFVVGSNIYSTLAFYIHERVWNKITWGKKK